MFKRSRVFALVICLMMVVTMFTGCTGSNTPTATEEKTGVAAGNSKAKELVIALTKEDSLDIHQITGFSVETGLMFQPLVTFSKDRQSLVPAVAESVSFSEDDKVITIKLPAGLTFTNGAPLTATAVKASFERLLKLSKLSSFFSAISKVEAPDPQTVIITCTTPPGSMLACLTNTMCGIVDADAANKAGDQAFLNNPVGYGAAYLKEWNKGNFMVLARNDKFKTNNPYVKNKGPLNFETIKFRYIPNNFTRVSELTSGNVDVIWGVPVENLESLKNNKDINVIQQPGIAASYLAVNLVRVSDVRVRTALNLAIDREQLKKALQEQINPMYGPLAPTWACFSNEAEEQYKKDYAFNIEKAKALLAEAGYKDTNGDGIVEKDGKPLELDLHLPNTSTSIKTLGPIFQAQYQQLGIKIKLIEGDVAAHTQARIKEEYDLMFTQAAWYDSSIFPLLLNLFKSLNNCSDKDKIEKLVAEAQNTIDIPVRTAKYAEAGKLIMKYSTMIPLYNANDYIACRSNIKGITFAPDGSVLINDVTKE